MDVLLDGGPSTLYYGHSPCFVQHNLQVPCGEKRCQVERRDSAVKLVDVLAGASPASADCPVGTVVISGDGAGDQADGSPDENVLDGWTQVWSAPRGGQAKRQVVAQANRS